MYSPAGPISVRTFRIALSQPSKVQLAVGMASESDCNEWLGIRIYLCRSMVHWDFCIINKGNTLTLSDIVEMVPRSIRRARKYMYLFHIYRTRDNQNIRDRQMYWYSWPKTRIISYKSSTVDNM